MKDWLLYSLLALLFWGLWAFFPRLGAVYVSSKSLVFYNTVGQVIVTGALMFVLAGKVEFHPLGALYGILTGIMALTGFFFFVLAIQKGNPSIVTALTSLYPLIAVVLFFLIFREFITVKQGIGVVLALVSVVLLAH